MAMVAPMAAGLEYAGLARGAAYGTAVALDGASWAPVAVAAYEHLPAGGSSSSSGLPMSGYIPSGTRKRHRQQNGGGYAKKKGAAPRKMILRKSVPFKSSGQTKYGDSRCVVALHNLASFTMAGGSDLNTLVKGSDVTSAPLFNRYANLYGKFRLKSFTVHFMPDSHQTHMLTAVTQLAETAPADQNGYLRDITCRFHDMSRRDQSFSRTLYTADVPLFNTFLDTSTNPAGMPDCAICFLVKHAENPPIQNRNFEIRVTWVVEFAYMNKIVSELDGVAP